MWKTWFWANDSKYRHITYRWKWFFVTINNLRFLPKNKASFGSALLSKFWQSISKSVFWNPATFVVNGRYRYDHGIERNLMEAWDATYDGRRQWLAIAPPRPPTRSRPLPWVAHRQPGSCLPHFRPPQVCSNRGVAVKSCPPFGFIDGRHWREIKERKHFREREDHMEGKERLGEEESELGSEKENEWRQNGNFAGEFGQQNGEAGHESGGEKNEEETSKA